MKNELKLMTCIAALAAMQVLPVAGQQKVAGDAVQNSEAVPLMIYVQVEFIEMTHEKLTELIFLRKPKADETELRKQVQGLVKKGEAQIVETMLGVTRSGEKATTESVREFIYPTEYEPAELPNSVRVDARGEEGGAGEDLSRLITPPTPTAFETRLVGSILEFEAGVGPDGLIELQLAPAVVANTGNVSWLVMKDPMENRNEILMPVFFLNQVSVRLTMKDGSCALAGSLTPKGENGEVAYDKKIMVFVKADVVPVKR